MSTPQGQVVRYVRAARRRKGLPDLNVPLVIENLGQAGELAASVPQDGQSGVPAIPIAGGGSNNQPAGSTAPAPIDVDDLDDDVTISSPGAFEEAKKKSRRSRRTHVVVDVESEETVTRHGHNQANKRRRGPPNPPIINCEVYVNLEGSSGSMRPQPRYVAPAPPPPPPPEPTIRCPICMGPFVEEVTTKCGHIFCKTCIELAVKAQHKCPTCRRKLTNKMYFRVFLPTSK